MKFFCNNIAYIKKIIVIILVVTIIILLITGRCSTMRIMMFW